MSQGWPCLRTALVARLYRPILGDFMSIDGHSAITEVNVSRLLG